MNGRWGLTIPLSGVPLPEHAALLASLPELGYTDAWSSEVAGNDGFTPLTLASVWAPSLRLGTAIAPVFTRGPALLAMTAAALAEAAPGRFALGIGASSDVIVGRWNGIAFDRPYAHTRDVVRFLRAALSGEKVTEQYETFSVEGFRLGLRPDPPPRILVAALRERMLRLGAREADGVILNWVSPQDVKRIAAIVTEDNPAAEIVTRIMVCPSEDAEAVRGFVRGLVTGYLTVPVYREYQKWLGHADALAPMWAAWDAGDRKAAVAAVPDAVVDAVCVHGPPDACKARIAEFVANGVTTPVLAVVPVGVDLRDAIHSLAP